MHKTLVNILLIHKGFQWAILKGTLIVECDDKSAVGL